MAVYLIQQVLIGESKFPVWSVASLTKRLVPTPEFILTDALGILPVFDPSLSAISTVLNSCSQ
jgi:hypothetical protein